MLQAQLGASSLKRLDVGELRFGRALAVFAELLRNAAEKFLCGGKLSSRCHVQILGRPGQLGGSGQRAQPRGVRVLRAKLAADVAEALRMILEQLPAQCQFVEVNGVCLRRYHPV